MLSFSNQADRLHWVYYLFNDPQLQNRSEVTQCWSIIEWRGIMLYQHPQFIPRIALHLPHFQVPSTVGSSKTICVRLPTHFTWQRMCYSSVSMDLWPCHRFVYLSHIHISNPLHSGSIAVDAYPKVVSIFVVESVC